MKRLISNMTFQAMVAATICIIAPDIYIWASYYVEESQRETVYTAYKISAILVIGCLIKVFAEDLLLCVLNPALTHLSTPVVHQMWLSHSGDTQNPRRFFLNTVKPSVMPFVAVACQVFVVFALYSTPEETIAPFASYLIVAFVICLSTFFSASMYHRMVPEISFLGVAKEKYHELIPGLFICAAFCIPTFVLTDLSRPKAHFLISLALALALAVIVFKGFRNSRDRFAAARAVNETRNFSGDTPIQTYSFKRCPELLPFFSRDEDGLPSIPSESLFSTEAFLQRYVTPLEIIPKLGYITVFEVENLDSNLPPYCLEMHPRANALDGYRVIITIPFEEVVSFELLPEESGEPRTTLPEESSAPIISSNDISEGNADKAKSSGRKISI